MESKVDSDYRYESGRRYHNHDAGAYYMPNDEKELSRLNTQHNIWLVNLDGALHRAPIVENPTSVLDVGTGSGIWAVDFANQHPNCNVRGIDLSPVKPNSATPPNCSFRVKDVETEWDFQDVGPFDLIHSRLLIEGMRDWRGYFAKCFRNLKPGGWVEAHEVQFPMYSANPSVAADAPFLRWGHIINVGLAKGGINGGAPNEFSSYLKLLGFGSVTEEKIELAVGPWKEDEKGRQMGEMHLANMRSGIEGMTAGVLTKNLGWTQGQVDEFLKEIQNDMDDPGKKYFEVV